MRLVEAFQSDLVWTKLGVVCRMPGSQSQMVVSLRFIARRARSKKFRHKLSHKDCEHPRQSAQSVRNLVMETVTQTYNIYVVRKEKANETYFTQSGQVTSKEAEQTTW